MERIKGVAAATAVPRGEIGKAERKDLRQPWMDGLIPSLGENERMKAIASGFSSWNEMN